MNTVDPRRHNLPDYLTSFVGRTSQLDELRGLIEQNRLVLLTGVGGTGKTRLAVEAARAAVSREPDGAWLVELAPVTNPQIIMTTIADTWGLRAGEGASIEDVVTRFLWSRAPPRRRFPGSGPLQRQSTGHTTYSNPPSK